MPGFVWFVLPPFADRWVTGPLITGPLTSAGRPEAACGESSVFLVSLVPTRSDCESMWSSLPLPLGEGRGEGNSLAQVPDSSPSPQSLSHGERGFFGILS